MAPLSQSHNMLTLVSLALGLCQFVGISAFNLDTDGALRKDGEAESLFGFSLAMHHQKQMGERKVLLVGAPHAKALGKQRANVTGGLYGCGFTTEPNDCHHIQFDTTETAEDHKENQWMGVRVRSQGPGGKVVVCAHRYQRGKSEESRVMPGRCIVLEQDLQEQVEERDPFCAEGGRLARPGGRTKEFFGYCQQGVSPAFTSDKKHILYGAPGGYDWKGIVRLEPIDWDVDYPKLLETGDEGENNPMLIPVNISSYLGFSIGSSTSLTNKGELIIVTGAPRAGHSGEVLLLRSEDGTKGLGLAHRLTEPGLASSFGYDLAVVDLNADGWDDLVVGAPQYFKKDGDVGGAVYVYINRAGGRDWNNLEPVCLQGKKDSMFGLAVGSIGDVNQDRFQDIAIGAPYEGPGHVYIHHGSAEGILKTPAQIIKGEGGVKLFGYSLAGNMDVDENGYPDVAVGTLSDSVFVYRAKPVINIEKTLKITPDKIDVKNYNCDLRQCSITVQSCFSFTTHPATYKPDINIRYMLEIDSQRREWNLPSRVAFKDPSQAEFKFVNLGCGNDNICRSNLDLQYQFVSRNKDTDLFTPLRSENGTAVISASDKKIDLKITVTNKGGENAYDTQLVATIPGPIFYMSYFSKEKSVYCTANANGTLVTCRLGDPLPRDGEVDLYITLTTMNITLSTSDVNVTLQLQTTSSQNISAVATRGRIIFDLNLLVYSHVSPSQVSVVGEKANVDSEMTSEQDIGSLVEYNFTISNLGLPLTSLATVSLDIHWPKLNKNGKWLLYLVQIEGKDGQKMSCSPTQEISPLQHIKAQGTSRGKRQAEESDLEALSTDGILSIFGRKRKYKTLVCGGEAQCVTIKCPLLGLEDKAVVHLRSRLWNSTFLEEYESLNYLDIVFNASLSIHSAPKNIGLRSPPTQVKLTVFPERKSLLHRRVPWWVIVLSLLLALVLLALLGFLLWKD
ncbi:integrin alpha-6-like [Alosa pseudoharengus]|uniref:integrin alpha-6-like n=1 Tax=Alosa pseudoharengus TaxID=34774 RepID=UPI003F8C622B